MGLIRGRTLAIALVVLLVGGMLVPVALADGGLEHGDERADLDIRQPSYVDSSVERSTTSNRTTYEVAGPQMQIRLESVDHANVTASGVLDGSGSLTYDEEIDAWIFDAEDEAGTRAVYFDVEETRTVTVEDGNNTTTEERTETVRHAATLSVESTEWAHRPADVDEKLKEDAANWSSVSSTARRLSDTDDVEATIEQAFEYYEFMSSPFASFAGDARGTIMMATRPGGLAVFGGILGLSATILGVTIVKLHRRERQLSEVGDVDAAREDAYLDMAEEVLQQRDWSDFLPEHLARHCRNYLGRNAYLGYKRYLLLRSPTHTKGLLLQLMAQVGYSGRARIEDGEVVEAHVVANTDVDEDLASDGGSELATVDLSRLDAESEEDRRFVDLVPGEDLDVDVLHRPDELDLDAVEWPIDEREASDSEIVEAINPQFPDDFTDEEQLADTLGGLMQLVSNHDFTDEEGRPRRSRDLLSFLSELDSVLTDEVDFPLAHVQRRMLFLAADRMDEEEELRDHVDRLGEEGLELGGDLEIGEGPNGDDDGGGGGSALVPNDGDDGDDSDVSDAVDDEDGVVDEGESVEETEEDSTGDTDDEEVETDGDEAALPSSDDVPIRALTEAAGYSIDTESGLDELAEDAGISWDMDGDEVVSRVLVCCRRQLSADDLVDILDGGDS